MTDAIAYKNTFKDMPGWAPGSFVDQPRGYAYEQDGRFLHLFGRAGPLWTISSGLTFIDVPDGSLEDWVTKKFAATDIAPMDLPAGTVVAGVWRPGLYWEDQVFQALNTDQIARRGAEQALHGLVERLTDLLLYVEPEGPGLSSYGPKSRELLILACTEVENSLAYYMRLAGTTPPSNGFNTGHYLKLCAPLHLAEFQVELAPYANAPSLRPFASWSAGAPTQSLPWYHAYNKTKHDRAQHLELATVERCLEAVAASVVMFCVRFGPFTLYNATTPLSSLVNHLFAVELIDCDPRTFYLPLVALPNGLAVSVAGTDSRAWTQPWAILPLTL